MTHPGPSTRSWYLGLAAVALMMAGSGWYQVWFAPPYRYVDEQAHVGYVLDIQRGVLPQIDSAISADGGGRALRQRLATEPERRHDVWVANNPPLPYLLAAVPSALSRALGLPGGALAGLRLLNLAGFTAAAVAVAFLGRRLAGGDQRVGLIAGALVAAAPHTGFLAGQAMTDGIALFCTVMLFTAIVTVLDEGANRRRLAWLIWWAASGAAVRPMTAVIGAVGLVLVASVLAVRRLRLGQIQPTSSSSPVSRRHDIVASRSIGIATCVVGLAAAGWYLRNWNLYGDPTGSTHLFDKFDRVGHAAISDFFTRPGHIRDMVVTLVLRRVQVALPSDLDGWWPVLAWVLVACILATATTLITDHVRPRSGSGSSGVGYAALGVLVLVNLVLMAQHWTGGGGLHPRYALPALVVLAAAVAFALVRAATVWTGLVAVAILLGVQAREIAYASDWTTETNTEPAGSLLAVGLGPTWLAGLGLGAVAVGAALLVFALVSGR